MPKPDINNYDELMAEKANLRAKWSDYIYSYILIAYD